MHTGSLTKRYGRVQCASCDAHG
eukprot:COSAG01_NODE_69414_length_261_cov_0.956790_1_plen_22_part_01